MPAVSRFAIILAAAVLLAVANAWVNPKRPPWSESVLAEGEIRLADALLADEVLWVDARSEPEYLERSIPGAVPLNEDQWDELLPEFLSIWQPEYTVVVYCGSQTCQASHGVAERLRTEVGLDEVHVLKGGWEAWLEHGN